jgi:hypothetical protein
VGYFGSAFSMKEIRLSIKSYMEVLENKEEPAQILEMDNKRKRRNQIIASIIVILGIVLFLLLLIY